ncbi:acyl carrier protein [Peterkaempfera bronchialis]|uniref:acyl carrier protein n=1 Tax=Peterkaempfera bronchialis TaxID=2126346 RepID=UPI0013B3EBD8|nr:acyl carrier protein [Peterkaempfera bronchialis]
MTSEPVDAVARDRVLDVIREVIAASLAVEVAEVPAESRLYTLPGIDSLKALRAVTEVEQRFGVTLDVAQVLVTHTVGELADIVAAAAEGKSS